MRVTIINLPGGKGSVWANQKAGKTLRVTLINTEAKKGVLAKQKAGNTVLFAIINLPARKAVFAQSKQPGTPSVSQ